MTSRFSIRVLKIFDQRGAMTPGDERINCNALIEGFKSLNSGITPGCNNLPCISGTLVKTPIPCLAADSNAETGYFELFVFFQVMLDHNTS